MPQGAAGTFRTKKQARAAGFRSLADLSRYEIPRRDAEPIIVRGEKFYRPDQIEPLISRTEARRRGLTVPADAPVERELSARVGDGAKTIRYDGYRLSDCRPVRKCTERPPNSIDLLAAIFAVNKSAKRYRDAASKCYGAGSHAFARAASRRKQELYDLKDRGIAEALRTDRLSLVGIHGGLALYRGAGYCFHSTLLRDVEPIPEALNTENVFVEAKPREATEPRLKDAIKTLEDLPDADEDCRRLSQPRHERIRTESRPQFFALEEGDSDNPNDADSRDDGDGWDDDGWDC